MSIPKGAPRDLYITEALDTRPPADPLPVDAVAAIQDLAGRMAHEPSEVLPRFVDLALELTGAMTGGLSLYEPDPAPGVFRWHYLRGTLSAFNGATTPRDFSPCGVTLDHDRPVLTLHPERVYSWLVDADVQLPEVLLVPLYLEDSEPFGTLWVVSEHEGHFTGDHARALKEISAFVGIAVRMLKSQAGLKQKLAEQTILTNEMKHRVRNVFALTDGLIRMSAKRAADKEELAEVLSGRLHSLSRAHALVTKTDNTDLATLLAEVTAPHRTPRDQPRVHLQGPHVVCSDHATTGLALIFHELTTNSAKYGALSQDGGRVDVAWQGDEHALRVTWTETGGPPPADRAKPSGLGSVLIKNTVRGQFRGKADYDWRPEGLRLTLDLILDEGSGRELPH